MKNLRNALNITADGHQLVKEGYLLLPTPIEITNGWLDSPSLLYKEKSNRERIMGDLGELNITEKDFDGLIGKTVLNVPDETIYGTYLEITRIDKIGDDMDYDAMQKYLFESDRYVDQMTEAYEKFCEHLFRRIWDYYLFKDQVKLERLTSAYKEQITESVIEALLFISINTPNLDLNVCFEK